MAWKLEIKLSLVTIRKYGGPRPIVQKYCSPSPFGLSVQSLLYFPRGGLHCKNCIRMCWGGNFHVKCVIQILRHKIACRTLMFKIAHFETTVLKSLQGGVGGLKFGILSWSFFGAIMTAPPPWHTSTPNPPHARGEMRMQCLKILKW